MRMPTTRVGKFLKEHRIALLAVILPYILIGVVVFAGLTAFSRQQTRESDRDTAQTREIEHDACVQRAQDRDALRAVVIISTTMNSSAGGVNLQAVPGFTDLDAKTQVFIENLFKTLATPTGARQNLQQQLLATIPPIDC